jgi:hypothetical protein
MIPLDLENILKHLKKNAIEAQLQKDTNQISIVFKIAERDFPVFIRIYDGQELVQLLAFLPCSTKQNTIADTARLLHLLNKELDVPGFGMDESASVVFYRCIIPAKNKQFDKDLFDAFLNAVQVVCRSFAPVIAAVAYGGVSFEEVLKKSLETGNRSVAQSQLREEDE